MPQDLSGYPVQPPKAGLEGYPVQPGTSKKKKNEAPEDWIEWTLRNAPPIIGGVIGAAGAGIPSLGLGTMGGGMFGAATGNVVGNTLADLYGGREFSPLKLATTTGLSALPPILGPAKFAGKGLGAITKYAVGTGLRSGAEGAIVGAGGTPFQHYAQTGNWDVPASEYLGNTISGGGLGLVLGTGMGAYHGRSLNNAPIPPPKVEATVPPPPPPPPPPVKSPIAPSVAPPPKGQMTLDLGPAPQNLFGPQHFPPMMEVPTPFDERFQRGPLGYTSREGTSPTRPMTPEAIEGPEVGPYGITKDHPQLPFDFGTDPNALMEQYGDVPLFGNEDMWGYTSPPLEVPPPPPAPLPPTPPPAAPPAVTPAVEPHVMEFRGKDKLELDRLLKLGYERIPGQRGPKGGPVLIRKAGPLPPGAESFPSASEGEAPPTQEGDVITFHEDDGFELPRHKVSGPKLAEFRQQGFEPVGENPKTKGIIFRRADAPLPDDNIAFESIDNDDPFSQKESDILPGERTGRVAQFPERLTAEERARGGPEPYPGPHEGEVPSQAQIDEWLNEPSGDIGTLRTQQTLGPRQMDPRMAARVEAGGQREFDFTPPEAGQMELPWSRGENPMPIDGDALARHQQEAADRMTQPMGEMGQQKSLEEQMKDAEIAAYLAGEDVIPPEGIDLSQYGPDDLMRESVEDKKPNFPDFRIGQARANQGTFEENLAFSSNEDLMAIRKSLADDVENAIRKADLFRNGSSRQTVTLAKRKLARVDAEISARHASLNEPSSQAKTRPRAERAGERQKRLDDLKAGIADAYSRGDMKQVVDLSQQLDQMVRPPLGEGRNEQMAPRDRSNDEPSFEIDEHGNFKGSVNDEDAIASVTRDYKGELSGIMVREGMQNSLDAVKDMTDGVVKIRITPEKGNKNAVLEINDNGLGMDKETLGYKLFEVFSSGKEGDPTATGGKGIGSASFIFGGDRFEIVTTAIDAKDGKKYTIKTGGSPVEIMRGIPPSQVEVPMSTPTGTTIKVTMKNGQEAIHARLMLDKVIEHTRNRKTKIIYDRQGDSTGQVLIHDLDTHYGLETTPRSSDDDKTVHTFKHKNTDVTIQVPKYDEDLENELMSIHVLNNGMYQFTKDRFVTKARGIPKDVIVNVEPKINEKHVDYPFINTREDVKDDLRDLIEEAVLENVSGPAIERKKNRTQEIYDAMPVVATKAPTKRPFVIFDPGERLTPNEMKFFQNHPIVQAWATHFDNLIDNIIKSTGRTSWGNRLERVGIVLDPGSHGIHVPNPSTGKSTIGFNPFLRIDSMSPSDAAFDATGTGLHEVAHIGSERRQMVTWNQSDFNHPRFGKYLQQMQDQVHGHGGRDQGHDMGFVHRLGENYAAFGPTRAFDAADQLEQIYTGGSGEYTPELQELLHLYNESRGRPEVVEDLLTRTGVEQANRKSRRKGILPGDSPTDGGGTPPNIDAIIAANAKKKKEPGSLQEWYNLSRGVTTTADLSAPMRQGLPLIGTKSWWTSWVPMVKSLGSEKAFQKTLADIKKRPLFQNQFDRRTNKIIPSMAYEAGMRLSDISTPLSRREETIASNWAESGDFLAKIPGAAQLYKKTAGRVARASNRAYTAYLNQLRADTFQSLVEDAQRMSGTALSTGKARPGLMKQSFNAMEALDLDPFINKKVAKDIADFVNTATGRGPLKLAGVTLKEGGMPGLKEYSLEKHAELLTNTLFSPRLFASRMRMLNPATYMMASPSIRKQYLKAAIATGGAWMTVAALGKIGGADVSLDTNSADFGKLKFRNTRLDPAAGFQQYLVAISRLLSGHESSSATQKDFELGQGYRADTRGDVALRFGINKMHPIAKFATDLAFASERTPFRAMDRTAQLFVPLVIGDLTEILSEDPSLLPLMAPIATGMGTQTYEKGESRGKFIDPENDFSFKGGELW